MKAITTSIFGNLFRGKIILGRNAHNRILITGIGKTGSTALFHIILNALPEDTLNLFEPEATGRTLPETVKPPVLVKSFVPYAGNFNFFDKKILIVRDPRDRIISYRLYCPFDLIIKSSESDLDNHLAKLKIFLEALKRKEKNPSDISLLELTQILDISPGLDPQMIIDYMGLHPEAFILKYEDLVDGKLGSLEKYLNLKLDKQVEIPEKHRRVIRSRSYDNWKDWMTASDVDFFRPQLDRFIKILGYKDDWSLNAEPKINPSVSSLYVERLIQEALAFRERRKLKEN